MTNTTNNTQELTLDQMNIVNGGYVKEGNNDGYVVDGETGEQIQKPASIFDIIYRMFLEQTENNYTIEQNATVHGDNNTIG